MELFIGKYVFLLIGFFFLFAFCELEDEGCTSSTSMYYDGNENYCLWNDATFSLYWESEIFCIHKYGGNLVEIIDSTMNTAINTWLKNENGDKFWWIGLNKDYCYGISSCDSESYFVWNSGSPISYDNHAGSVNYINSCYRIFSRDGLEGWYATSCGDSQYRVCSRHSKVLASVCGKGKYFNGRCYYLVDKEKNWSDAEDYCKEKYKGNLGSIETNEEFAYIKNFVQSIETTPIWYADVWIGLNDQSVEGTFQNSDGTSATHYTSDVHHQTWWDTSNGGNNEAKDCAFLSDTGSQKLIVMDDCSLTKKFVCKRDAIDIDVSTNTISSSEIEVEIVVSGNTHEGITGKAPIDIIDGCSSDEWIHSYSSADKTWTVKRSFSPGDMGDCNFDTEENGSQLIWSKMIKVTSGRFFSTFVKVEFESSTVATKGEIKIFSKINEADEEYVPVDINITRCTSDQYDEEYGNDTYEKGTTAYFKVISSTTLSLPSIFLSLYENCSTTDKVLPSILTDHGSFFSVEISIPDENDLGILENVCFAMSGDIDENRRTNFVESGISRIGSTKNLINKNEKEKENVNISPINIGIYVTVLALVFGSIMFFSFIKIQKKAKEIEKEIELISNNQIN